LKRERLWVIGKSFHIPYSHVTTHQPKPEDIETAQLRVASASPPKPLTLAEVKKQKAKRMLVESVGGSQKEKQRSGASFSKSSIIGDDGAPGSTGSSSSSSSKAEGHSDGGGKTGMARRMSWDEPCLTLTCSPAQKQTERCHPDETRPFTIREYARIQTFPDNWKFEGPITSQYKQIGNAVPVNLAEEIGYTIIKALNDYHKAMNAHNNLKYTFDNIASIDQRQIISG
jgi:site-specific DNA-cytosine methylase